MGPISDDEVVFTEGPATRRARLYRWLLDHLAKFPGRVTVVTFVAGALVTLVVVALDGDTSPTTVVSLIATLWALFFAVMIYLLTARDTDKVLDQISDLHEQLATALAAPDEGDDGLPDTEEEEEEEEEVGAVEDEPAAPAPAPPQEPAQLPASSTPPPARVPAPTPRPTTSPDSTTQREAQRERASVPADGYRNHNRPGFNANRTPGLLVGPDAIVARVPSELLDAWSSATGENRDQLSRAWSRDPRTDRQWVLETTGHERWVVFSKGDRGVGVMSLDADNRRGTRRR